MSRERRAPRRTDTQVIDVSPGAFMEPMPTPSLAQDIADGLASPGLREFAEACGDWYDSPSPVPSRDSLRPADRQEFLDAIGGDEPLFSALIAEREAMYLLDTSLPVPPRAGTAGDTKPAPGAPPSGDSAAARTSAPSPAAPGAVPAEDGPVQDEPDAEPDCAEGGAA